MDEFFNGAARILVTGGAGFIGCNLVRHLLDATPVRVLNVDKLVFPGCRANLEDFENNQRHQFEQMDVGDTRALNKLFREFRPTAVMHLAAESHVDRSIDAPDAFVDSNIRGTFSLLEAVRTYLHAASARQSFRFLHISTDEVHGSLGPGDAAFTESTPYRPNSPYAASKAAADHLARAWHHTYGLPIVTSNCSNNYGPRQFPEKLIPLTILKALRGEPIPVYGAGANVRDWLYVRDHVRALCSILARGKSGERYNVGGNSERRNIDVVRAICAILDELRPSERGESHARLISYVADRPGHDFRYAINSDKLRAELGWTPAVDFDAGLRRTVEWYVNHQDWCVAVMHDTYQGQRLGLAAQ